MHRGCPVSNLQSRLPDRLLSSSLEPSQAPDPSGSVRAQMAQPASLPPATLGAAGKKNFSINARFDPIAAAVFFQFLELLVLELLRE